MRAALLLLLIPAVAHADRDDCVRTGGRWVTDASGTGCMRAGKRDGTWEKRAITGQLLHRKQYKAGVLEGPSVAFNPATCEIASKGAFKAGKQDGPWTTWFDSGQKANEGSYVAGSREGVWKFYTGGIAVMEGPMVGDAANGTFTERFTTGATWRKPEIRDGKRTTPEAKRCLERGGSWEIDHRERHEGCLVDGRRQGDWLEYTGDGKLASRATYVDNELDGERIDYHPGGEILRRGRYIAGVPDGLHEFKSASGELYGASTITNGSGTWKAYFPDGILAEDGAYAGGQRDGVWRTFHRKGAPLDETTWKHGLRDGPYRKHYITGEVEVVGQYRLNRRAGQWVATYPNGHIVWTGGYDDRGWTTNFYYFGNYDGTAAAIGRMVDDHREGTWTLFHDNGAVQGIGPYVEGRKHGPWFEYWPSGKFWRVVHYVDDVEDSAAARACASAGGTWISDDAERALGCQVCRSEKEDDKGGVEQRKIGVWTWWHANAAVEKQGTFVAGLRDGRWQTWFDNGQLMLDVTYALDKETGPARGYFRDGKLRFEGAYVDGAEDGEWTTYHGDGTIASRGRYARGKKTGRWIYNYAGGVKKEEGDYEDGAPSGVWTSYHPNGTRAAEGAYASGKRDGTWTYWRPDGSPWRSERFAAGKPAARAHELKPPGGP
jgi:antitoxin component YwqK of YwqJK toxin-antitoxin module